MLCVVAIFLIGGLKLKTAEAKEALAAWQARYIYIYIYISIYLSIDIYIYMSLSNKRILAHHKCILGALLHCRFEFGA